LFGSRVEEAGGRENTRLDDYEKGGISYFKIAADTIFKMSSMAEDSLKSFMKEFGKQGLAKISHENVRTISMQMDGVAERLANSGVLRSKLLIQHLTGLTICLVALFKAVFMNRLTEFTYADATGDVTLSSMSSSEVLVKIKEISTAAKAIYEHLHLGNKWNIPGKPGLNVNATATKCDNCGELDHISPKCPKPSDEENCKKARDARAQAKRTLREVAVVVEPVEAVEAVVDVEVEMVVERGNVLLGMMTARRKASTLVS
jgi:hypothetical protein